ncbi:MAG: NADH-quinone oxidoreductase subunit [Rickettsiaceae bacterium]|jgi:NADH-quinone oxidoreductase subunit N|nr:NADH-quinone oxidoreductase subunit [Rickettsiaceae bacterium]
MTEFAMTNINAVLPEIFLVVSAMFLLILGAMKGNDFGMKQIGMAKGVVFITMFLLSTLSYGVHTSFNGMVISSGFTIFCKMLVLIGSALSLYLAGGYYRENRKNCFPEFSVLMLLSVAGMFVMISANSLISLYVGLELQSLALYIMASIERDNEKSSEAGLKYFVLGALSSGIILYGCSLIYGFSGTINFDDLRALYAGQESLPVGVLIGLVFLITGICFKISAVPFHMWTPDVYEGSPNPVTAFFVVAPKVAAIALFIQLMLHPFASSIGQWQQIIVFVSIASMIVGALGAMRQTNIKRLVAYSSIGHVGYILVGLASANLEGIKSILLYLTVYITLSIGIFACIMMTKRKEGKSEDIASLSGLAKTRPFMAMFIAVIMLSMAGIPPFAGFFAKFFIFFAAVKQGLYTLAVVGVLSSVIAAYYYLRIIKIMYLDESTVALDKNVQPEMNYIAFGVAAFNLLFFIGFTPFLNVAERAASWLF